MHYINILKILAIWATLALPTQAQQLAPVVSGLTAPVDIADPQDGTGRLFIVEQHGIVQTLLASGELAAPLLDLSEKLLTLDEGFEERGLLGFALHPGFAQNGRVYVSYSAPLATGAPAGWNHTRRISELTLSQGRDSIDVGTERVLISLDWPSRKHNGGALGFGPDGFLYIGLGDGGGAHGVGQEVLWSAFDVVESQLHWDRMAQDVTSLFGAILRIDVDRGFPGYDIPPSNPFVGKSGRDEVFAWGVRNPYRLSFDQKTGAIFAPMVAETLWEAVYLLDGPANLGWALREGTHCLDRLAPRAPPQDCARHDSLGYRLKDPIVEYANMQVMHPDTKLGLEGVGTAITGAQLYRGTALPDLHGRLIVSDWSADFRTPSGQLFVATPSSSLGALWPLEKLADFETRITGLASDATGEIYILTNDMLCPCGTTGQVFKLVP